MQFKLLGIQGATSIEIVTAATAKLSGAELVAAIASANLTKEEQKSILMKHGLSGEELEAAMQTLAHSAANTTATVTTGALTTATGGLSAAFRGLTVAMASNPIGTIAVAIATVIGLVSTAITVFSNWSNSIEDVKDKANELKNDFDNQSNTISENTEKLKSLKSEFEELSKGVSEYGENISLTGDEYERYKEIVQTILGISPSLIDGYDKEGIAIANKNGLLEKSIALMEEEQRLEKEKLTRTDNLSTFLNAGKEDLKTAKDDANNINKPTDISFSTVKNGKSGGLFDILFNGGRFKGEHGGFRSPIEKYIEHIIGIKKDTGESETDYILKNYNEIYKHIDEIIADSQKNFTDDTGEWIGFSDKQAESFRNYLLQFKDYLDTQEKVNSEFNDYLQLIPESMKEYSELSNSSKSFLSEWIKKNFAIDENTTEQDVEKYSSKIRKFVKQIAKDSDLQSLFDFGTELTTDKDNKNLSVEDYQNKIKEFVEKVNNIKDEDTKLYIKTVFGFEEDDDALAKDVNDKIKRVQNILTDSDNEKVSGLSMQELNIAYNISAEEGSLTFDELKTKIKETQQQVSEGDFALTKDQIKEFKLIFSDADKLNKAYQNLFAGKLTTNDVAELVDLFPTLGEYVDWTDEKFGNLAEGIDKVIRERPADLIKQLEEIDKSGMSDEAKKAIDSMIAALKQLKPELKDTKTTIEEIQKAIKGVSSSISTLIGFTKEISENGSLSLSSIDTIMTDDTYKSLRPYINDMESMKTAIIELTNKQKDAYEDLYNAEMYEKDYEAYHKAVQQKEQENENLLNDSVKQIEDEIKYFNDAYGIDITNWDNLSETKKTILQNTNAELLSKQASLINTFKSYYDTDLTNYKNTTAAKAAILENFRKSEAFAQATKIAIENDALGNDYGEIFLADKDGNIKNKINSILSSSGLTWEDYVQYLKSGTFTSKGNEALQKSLDEIVKPYSITPIDWEKMTANIKSTGSSSSSSSSPSGSSSSSSSSSSSKNYIDWIERRLKKFAQTTKEVFAKVADYISFNNQNSQLRKAINAIRDEIAANEQSYQYYMDEANKVGLDPYWQWFVQNGARNISDIQDEALREKISRYKELYDNAINCKNAVEDLKKTEKEYATQMLSNVEKYYSNRITYTNSNVEYYNSLDTDNLFVSKNYDAIRKSYNEQISYTQKQHDNLLSTLNSLVSSGSIKYQSDEWYEWWDKIQKCNVEVRNLKKNIHDLASEELQNIQEYWDNRIGVYDSTISYINTVGGDSTRKGSKDYKGLENAYNSQIKHTSKQVLELQARLNKAVKAGDIEKYSDKWYEWVGIIEQGKEKVVELQTNIHQLAVDELQDIQNRWDNRINNANSTAEYFNSVDTDNLYINKNFGEIRKSYKKQIADTKKEKQKLIKELNSSDIEKYSNEWYEWQKKIDDCDVSVRNLQKSVRNLANEELQGIQNRWDNRIGVYDSTISYINTVGGDTTRKGSKNYKGLSSAYNSQIGYTNKQVSELQARLDKAVKAGDIEKYSDEWYEWTGIIEQGKEKVAELQANIHKLVVEQFEEIQKNYDNQLNLFEHTAKEYENKNKEIETRGLLANSKYYFKLQENEKNNISILKNQAKDLEDSLNQAVKSGNIEVGSEEWYKMRDAILSVNEQIDESNIKLLEYAKTIREIGWEVFSFLQDRISQLTAESDFLIELMSNSKLFDDSGNITSKGKATLGLHTQNYNVYMAQAEQYAEEIRRVNAQLAQDPHNTDIIKHREELLELQQKSILSAEKEKKAIIDLTKEGFDAQLKSLKKLIETYTKSLDAAKSLYDYQKNINDKTSNITKLQKQLNAYQGDSSEETQARIQQLQTKLKEAQEDLQQTEYEKLISDTKSLLDDLYDNYEETLNNRLDNVDALVGDMIGVVNSNSNDINNTIKSSATEVGAILSKEITDIWSGKGAVNGNIVSGYYNGFNTKLTSVQTTLNNISNNVSTLAQAGEKENQSTTSTTTKPTTTNNKPSTPQGTKNSSNSKKTTNNANKTTNTKKSSSNTNSKKTTNNANKTTNTKKSSSNTNKHNTNSSKQRTDKENYGVALAIINGNYGWGSGDVRKKNLTAKGFNYDTVQGIVNKLWKDGYVHTGAWKGKYYGISDLSPYAYKKFKSGGLVDYTGIAQVDGTPMKPESFLNADDTQNISDLRDTLRELAARPITMVNGMGALGMFGGTVTPNILDMSQKLQALSGSDMVQNLNVHNENHIEIDIDKVEDYNDFIAKMQKDRKFENIIQDMTFGRMNGGSSLAKYRH